MRVAILGCGLIGGSIGLALHERGLAEEVTAFDRSPKVLQEAEKRGAADRTTDDPAAAVAGADVVFVATPVLSIAEVVRRAIPGLKAAAVVTDTGSTKSRVVHEITGLLGDNHQFIGGHPMAGTEEEGIAGAKASLFDGAWWILTPTPRVDPKSYQTVHSLLSGMGSHVLALQPSQHDELMAIISHLPHLTAATLMNMAADHGRAQASLLSLAAGGFRDLTRVAASNPTIWIDICTENRDAIVRALEEFANRLVDLRLLIQNSDMGALKARLLTARESRRSLTGRKTEGELFEISIPVPDRPGVLSEITTLIGNLGVNIEDLQITHAEEGGRGLLRLQVLGINEAVRAENALATQGFDPRMISI